VNTPSRNLSTHATSGLLTAVLVSIAVAGCVQYTTAPAFTPPTQEALPVASKDPQEASSSSAQDWVILSIEEDGYAHLYAIEPASATVTRLTWGQWSDITPALSPNRDLVAFASDRGGFWDLYTLDLQTAAVSRLTNSRAYDASPTWSPDTAWIAYETYRDGQLDIAIQSLLNPTEEPALLTDDPGSDHSPAWSPDGRLIAFVSNRTGDADIWLANLDKTAERFTNLSHSPSGNESHPAWSPDGSRMAWAASIPSPGYAGVYLWDISRPEIGALWAGSGTWPTFDSSGTRILTAVDTPQQQLLTAYTLDGGPVLLPRELPGRLRGLIGPRVALPDPLPEGFREAAAQTPQPLFVGQVAPLSDVPSKRWHVVSLPDVQAPAASLHALAAQPFQDLRERVIAEVGWDPLASLESAYLPLTTALDPGLSEDWLYTGRAFAINTLMVNAGWMAVSREDIGDRTYWRLHVRTQNQDGSQGAPLTDPPWDINTRYQLDPKAYEAGGSYAPVPTGYWVDLTSLAGAYGWERLPALPDWRTYYSGARFTEFALTGGLDWYSAMLELYPPEALLTPTAVLPPTVTPSRTPSPTATPSPTRTPSATPTASLSPTPRPPTSTSTPPSTPAPSSAPARSPTPVPSSTPPTIIPTFPTPTP